MRLGRDGTGVRRSRIHAGGIRAWRRSGSRRAGDAGGCIEQIGDSLAVILTPDRLRKDSTHSCRESRVFFHLCDNRAADNDFAARVTFAGFRRGFLFKRVETLGEGFPLLFYPRNAFIDILDHAHAS